MDNKGKDGQNDVEAFYTLSEAATLLRVAERTMRRLLQEGKMRGYRVGRQWRIPRADIDKMRAPGEPRPGSHLPDTVPDEKSPPSIPPEEGPPRVCLC
jgi:excisionase family DNA binding protein